MSEHKKQSAAKGRYLTLHEAVQEHQLGASTIRRWARDGHISKITEVIGVTRHVYYDARELARFVAKKQKELKDQ